MDMVLDMVGGIVAIFGLLDEAKLGPISILDFMCMGLIAGMVVAFVKGKK